MGTVWLYGLFNGHNGVESARFSRDRIAAEILLGQMPTTEIDQIAKEIIEYIFNNIQMFYSKIKN